MVDNYLSSSGTNIPIKITKFGLGFGGASPTINSPITVRGSLAGVFEIIVDNASTATGNRRGIAFHENGSEIARVRVVGAGEATPRGSIIVAPSVVTGQSYLLGGNAVGISVDTDGRVDAGGTLRVTGQTNPTSGAGVEILFGGSVGQILSYDRGATAYRALTLDALSHAFKVSGTTHLALIAGGITDASFIRATANAVPASGAGVEIAFASGTGYVTAWNRTAAVAQNLRFTGSTVEIVSGGAVRLTALSDGRIESSSIIRTTGQAGVPTSGSGIELLHTGTEGYITSATRAANTTITLQNLWMRGLTITFAGPSYFAYFSNSQFLTWQGATPAYAITLVNNASSTHGFGQAYGWVTYSSSSQKSDIRPLEEGSTTPSVSKRRKALKRPKKKHEIQAGRLYGKGVRKSILDAIEQLNPVLYKGPGFDDMAAETDDLGLLAEEVAEVFPEIVLTNPDTGEPTGILYDRLTVILLQGLKTLKRRMEQLEGAKK